MHQPFWQVHRNRLLLCALVGWVGVLLVTSLYLTTSESNRVIMVVELCLGIAYVGGNTLLLYRLLTGEQQSREEAHISGWRRKAFKAAVEAVPVGLIALNRQSVVKYWSPAAARIFGLPENEAIGQPLPLEAAQCPEGWVERAMAGDLHDGFQTAYRRPDGVLLQLHLRAAPLCAPDGPVSGAMVAVGDITTQMRASQAARATQSRLLMLAEVGRHLANADLALRDRVAKAIKIMVPFFADWCILDLMEDDFLRRLTVAHSDRTKADVAEDLQRMDLTDPLTQLRLRTVLGNSDGTLEQVLSGDGTVPMSTDSPMVDFLARRGVHCTSAIRVPIQVRGRLLGLITLLNAESGRVYTPDDLSLARDVAMRIGILLEDDRRLQETTRVGRDLEQRVAELHGLSEAAVAITSSLRLDEMLQVISDQARVLIGANVSGAALVSPEGGVLDLVAYSFTKKQAAFATYKTDQPITGAGIHNWIMKNRTNVRLTQAQLESHRAFERFGPEGGKHPPLRGLLAVPLIARNGEALGFIQVSDRYEGEFTEHDEQLLAHFGRLAAVAVENGRLHQRVRQAEGRVHNQAELLKAVTDSTAEAILGLDYAGRISFANQVAQTLLGASGAGLIGHCLHDIIQCEQAEADCRNGHCMVMQVLQTGRAQLARETLFTRQDGTYLPVSYSATPIERYGAISGAVISFRPLVSRSGALGWRTAQDGPAQ